MKQKVIDVKYRKDSKTFPEWLKYEVTILNEDGTENKIPAYGKDLQDALSRVVHDTKVEKVQRRTKRIPNMVWAALWFGYITALWFYSITLSNPYTAISFSIGMVAITLTVGYISTWFRKRNTIQAVPEAIKGHYDNAISSSGSFNTNRMSEK